MREQWAETLTGLVVIALAAIFLAYSLSVGRASSSAGRYEVTARFGEAGGLKSGASVTLAGVKVGTVAAIELEPKTFLAIARLSIDRDVKLPADSSAKITSDGLLGGAHIAIAPGGAAEDLQPGGEIENTQGAVDLFGLIGQVMRPPAGQAPPAPAPGAGVSALPDM